MKILIIAQAPKPPTGKPAPWVLGQYTGEI